MSEWHPIETAPRNGAHIIGISSLDGDVFRASWGTNNHGEYAWLTPVGWRTADEVEFWMPLPPRPHRIDRRRE